MEGTGSGTVSLVGDVMISRPLVQSGRGGAPGFQAAVAALRETDLAVANLEMPLSRRGSPVPKYSNLRSDPDVILDVRAMGVHAVSLANNHSYDYGPDALHDTVAACREAGKPGIAPIQIGWSYEPAVNLTVEQPGTVPRVHTWASRADQETVCARIAALRAEGHAVIVAIHWGVPEHWMSPFQAGSPSTSGRSATR